MTREQKEANFKRLAGKKQGDVLRAILRLQNLSNQSFYSYSKEDIIALLKPLEKALQLSKDILLGIKKGGFNL